MKKYLFCFVILLYIIGNLYVFSRFLDVINTLELPLKGFFYIIAGAMSGCIFLFYGLQSRLPVNLASFFYKIGTGWLMLLIYAFLICVFADIISLINSIIIKLPYPWLQIGNPVRSGILIGITVIFAVVGFFSYWKKNRVELEIKVDKKLEKDLKIVFISDLHLGYSIQKKELKSWVDLINKEKPDLVLIGGDVIDFSVRPLEYLKLSEILKKLTPRYGVFTCLGNHEYLAGVQKSIEFLKKANINVLQDQFVYLKQAGIYIIGRDDKTNVNRLAVKELIKDIEPDKVSILLDHQPYALQMANKSKIDLQLSGHTHRGQVWPISWITDAIFEKSHGYLNKNITQYYVSSGIGIWGGRYRLGTSSEYVVIRLRGN
ncbi:metallophosphoesterase [Myroides sp. LJL119]